MLKQGNITHCMKLTRHTFGELVNLVAICGYFSITTFRNFTSPLSEVAEKSLPYRDRPQTTYSTNQIFITTKYN